MDAPAVDGIAAAISVLNADLERQVGRVAELRKLVARLEDYHANGTAPPLPSPPVAGNGRRRHDGTPDDAARRAKKALLMRQRRAKLRLKATSEAAATPSVKKNGSGAGNNEPAADTPEAAVAMTADDIGTRLASATLPEIVALAKAADNAVADAEAAQDVQGFREALEVRYRAQRRCGELLLRMGKRVLPASRIGIENQVQRWRELARVDAERFEQRVALLRKRWPRGVPHRKDPPPPPKPVITISGWEVDSNGCRSRVLVAAGEPTPLKHEGPLV